MAKATLAGGLKAHPLLVRWVRRRAAVEIHKTEGFSWPDAKAMVAEVSDEEIYGAVQKVAKAKGEEIPSEVGADGDHPFLDWIMANLPAILQAIMEILALFPKTPAPA